MESLAKIEVQIFYLFRLGAFFPSENFFGESISTSEPLSSFRTIRSVTNATEGER
jgi:hypothetical protein